MAATHMPVSTVLFGFKIFHFYNISAQTGGRRRSDTISAVSMQTESSSTSICGERIQNSLKDAVNMI